MKKFIYSLMVVAGMSISIVTQSNPANAIAKDLFKRAIYDAGKYILLKEDPNHKATLAASAGDVFLDTCDSHQKGWYAEQLVYDHRTIQNGWRSDPRSTNMGVPTANHRSYPANFEYYDFHVYV